MLLPSLALLFLSLALAWAVFSKGGVYPADCAITLLAIASTAILYFVSTIRRPRSPSLNPAVTVLLLAIPAYIGFQLIPLPLPVLQFLSPARASLATAVAGLIPISRAPLSVNPPGALLKLFTFIGCIVTFLFTRELSGQFRSRIWIPILPLFCIAFLEASIGFVQISNAEPNAFANGTYVNRNHFSGLLELILPLTFVAGLALFRLRRSHSSIPRVLVICSPWLLSIDVLLAIFYSLSRAGFLIALTTLFLVGALSLPAHASRNLKFKWLGALALLALLFFIFIPPGELIERFADLSSAGNISTEARPFIWRETLSLIAEFPWFGCGLGGYESTFLKHQAIAAAFSIPFAHNDYLQYLAELGIVGFCILTAALLGILLPIFRSLKSDDESRRLLTIGCMGTITAIALHSLVDFNLFIPANALTLAWILGVASANVPAEPGIP